MSSYDAVMKMLIISFQLKFSFVNDALYVRKFWL